MNSAIERTPVDARFAGGVIFVGRDDQYRSAGLRLRDLPYMGDGRALVVVDGPGQNSLALFPHEARALAAALLAAADGREA